MPTATERQGLLAEERVAQEREACARLVEEWVLPSGVKIGHGAVASLRAALQAAATAIRARGKQP